MGAEGGVSGAPVINFKEDAVEDSLQGREGSQDPETESEPVLQN